MFLPSARKLASVRNTKAIYRKNVALSFSESQFKTLKYRPDFPDRFACHGHGLDFADLAESGSQGDDVVDM